MLFFWNLRDHNPHADFYYFFFTQGDNKEEAVKNLERYLGEAGYPLSRLPSRNIHAEPIDPKQKVIFQSIGNYDDEGSEKVAAELTKKAEEKIASGIYAHEIELDRGEVWSHR
jgi:hypothetical protein